MLDMTGLFLVRGEVSKRTSGKAYGVTFTDLIMGAAHIDAEFGYDITSFLVCLSRFVSIRRMTRSYPGWFCINLSPFN